MTTSDDGALGAVPEPADRRPALRRALLEAGRFTDEAGAELTDWLWAVWGSDLGAGGLDAAWLGQVVAGFRRELWLWAMGERRWEPLVDALAGRVARRLPA